MRTFLNALLNLNIDTYSITTLWICDSMFLDPGISKHLSLEGAFFRISSITCRCLQHKSVGKIVNIDLIILKFDTQGNDDPPINIWTRNCIFLNFCGNVNLRNDAYKCMPQNVSSMFFRFVIATARPNRLDWKLSFCQDIRNQARSGPLVSLLLQEVVTPATKNDEFCSTVHVSKDNTQKVVS